MDVGRGIEMKCLFIAAISISFSNMSHRLETVIGAMVEKFSNIKFTVIDDPPKPSLAGGAKPRASEAITTTTTTCFHYRYVKTAGETLTVERCKRCFTVSPGSCELLDARPWEDSPVRTKILLHW